jgi:hypothetical protein
MATFYWLGTARTEFNKNSLDPYDWNFPGNWLVRSSSFGPYVIPNEAPGAGDTVYIGTLPDSQLPAGVSGMTMARSPLLFGGCSGMSPIGVPANATGPNAVWLNSKYLEMSGGTSSSDLTQLFAYLDEHPSYPNPANPTTRIYHQFPFYCFPYLGGGVGNQTDEGIEISYWLFETRGCTAALGSGPERGGILTKRQQDGLNLRIKQQLTVNTTGRINPQYPVGAYQNYQKVDINLVASKPSTVSSANPTACSRLSIDLRGNTKASRLSSTSGNVNANIRGSGDVKIKRYSSINLENGVLVTKNTGGVPLINNVLITNPITQLEYDSPDNLEYQWELGLTSASSRSLRATISDAMILYCVAYNVPGVLIDGCTMGRFSSVENILLSETDSTSAIVKDEEAIVLSSSFDGIQVKNALGFGGSAYAGMNTITIEGVYGTEGNSKTLKNPRLVLGDVILTDAVTASANTVKVDNISIGVEILGPPISTSGIDFIPLPWQLEFIGPASVTSVDASNCKIVANNNFRDFTTGLSGINITTLNLGNSATLDLNSVPSFDDWFFGSYITGSTNNGFIGGLVLEDQTAKIIPSRGVRLYNTKKVGTNYDTRGGTYIP